MTPTLPLIRRLALTLAVICGLLGGLLLPAGAATEIERIVSPGGIEAWLVRQTTLPLIAIDFAFRGGSNQDPADRLGLANMTASLLDEGAGPLDARAFHERIEGNAIGISFSASRDSFTGSLRTLVDRRDQAFEMLKLALTAPRFDGEAVERIRGQIMSELRRATTNPSSIANRRWWETAFPDHPYAHPVNGTPQSVAAITRADLVGVTKRIFARDTLKIAIVGNVDATAAGAIVDHIFGDLPAKADLASIASVRPHGLGRRITINLDVAQSVVMIGGEGIPRADPDFMAAYVLNHILGGGAFSSRLYREVREVRGLAYSVYSMLMPLDYAALFLGGTATRADRTGQTLDVVQSEISRMAAEGPTAEELADAKSYLKGSFALRFDTSSKIASQLVQIQLENLGIDYIVKRNSLVDAVTLADVKRVAKRLLDGGMLVTVVGRSPTGEGAPAPGGQETPDVAAKRDGG